MGQRELVRHGYGVWEMLGEHQIHFRDECRLEKGHMPGAFLIPFDREVGSRPFGGVIRTGGAHLARDAVTMIRFWLSIEHTKNAV